VVDITVWVHHSQGPNPNPNPNPNPMAALGYGGPLPISRQFLDRQFLDWVRNRVRVRVRVRVMVRVRVPFLDRQELTVQEVSCNPTANVGRSAK